MTDSEAPVLVTFGVGSAVHGALEVDILPRDRNGADVPVFVVVLLATATRVGDDAPREPGDASRVQFVGGLLERCSDVHLFPPPLEAEFLHEQVLVLRVTLPVVDVVFQGNGVDTRVHVHWR